ncbi:hypothetical protein ABR738_02095 [Streptomyces sp. Edi4]|uniref:hypothetical protein n=1 Tax=Streptomyces sp. Edi4 TaxID=3162527 RepID=UPI003305CE14
MLTSSDVVGTWSAEVARPSKTSLSTFRFTADGQALLLSGGVGAGTWIPTGPDSFSYRIAEPLFDPQGGYLGWVDIDQHAVRQGSAFTSTGISTVYDADDRCAYRAPVDITAHRSAG